MCLLTDVRILNQWIPGLDVGTAAVTVDNVTINGPVFDGGITFANLILPPP